MKNIIIIITIYILMNGIINRIANDNVVERANEVSEERINNNIMWRTDIYENEYKNKI